MHNQTVRTGKSLTLQDQGIGETKYLLLHNEQIIVRPRGHQKSPLGLNTLTSIMSPLAPALCLLTLRTRKTKVLWAAKTQHTDQSEQVNYYSQAAS